MGHLHAKSIELEAGQRYFGVRFKLGYTPTLNAVLPKELIEQEIPLEDLDSKASVLIEQIALCDDFTERINLFINNFHQHLLLPHKCPPLCSVLSQLITSRQGNIRIGDLVQYTRYSPRSINKIFSDYYGFSPKVFCLILRFQSALLELTHNRHLNLTELAQSLGYADQSHFFE